MSTETTHFMNINMVYGMNDTWVELDTSAGCQGSDLTENIIMTSQPQYQGWPSSPMWVQAFVPAKQ